MNNTTNTEYTYMQIYIHQTWNQYPMKSDFSIIYFEFLSFKHIYYTLNIKVHISVYIKEISAAK